MPVSQFPSTPAAGVFGPKKIPIGFLWAVQFMLSSPAGNDGHIVQEIFQMQTGTNASGVPVSLGIHYWEAWPVLKGDVGPAPAARLTVRAFVTSAGARPPTSDTSFNVAVDDIFFKTFATGNVGTMIMLASAAFYEEPLTPDFIARNPSTGAGDLLSTTSRPTFWSGPGLFRIARYEFDFSRGTGTSRAVFGTYQQPNGTVARTSPRWPGDFTIHT